MFFARNFFCKRVKWGFLSRNIFRGKNSLLATKSISWLKLHFWPLKSFSSHKLAFCPETYSWLNCIVILENKYLATSKFCGKADFVRLKLVCLE